MESQFVQRLELLDDDVGVTSFLRLAKANKAKSGECPKIRTQLASVLKLSWNFLTATSRRYWDILFLIAEPASLEVPLSPTYADVRVSSHESFDTIQVSSNRYTIGVSSRKPPSTDLRKRNIFGTHYP